MIAYQDLLVSTDQASQIALDLFGLNGKVTPLDGDVDFNFKIIQRLPFMKGSSGNLLASFYKQGF